MGPKGFKMVELENGHLGQECRSKGMEVGVPKVDSFLLSCFVLFLSCLFQVIISLKTERVNL